MTAAEIAAFRLHFPEFANETSFPDEMVSFWSGIGISRLNAERWGDLLTHGIELITAHYIVLATKDLSTADQGGIAGGSSGVVAGKAVGSVSVSYDTNAVNIERAGNFNLTRYGRDFFQLARIIGIGGLQLL